MKVTVSVTGPRKDDYLPGESHFNVTVLPGLSSLFLNVKYVLAYVAWNTEWDKMGFGISSFCTEVVLIQVTLCSIPCSILFYCHMKYINTYVRTLLYMRIRT